MEEVGANSVGTRTSLLFLPNELILEYVANSLGHHKPMTNDH